MTPPTIRMMDSRGTTTAGTTCILSPPSLSCNAFAVHEGHADELDADVSGPERYAESGSEVRYLASRGT